MLYNRTFSAYTNLFPHPLPLQDFFRGQVPCTFSFSWGGGGKIVCYHNLNLGTHHNLNAWKRAQTNTHYVSNSVFVLLSKLYSRGDITKYQTMISKLKMVLVIVLLPKMSQPAFYFLFDVLGNINFIEWSGGHVPLPPENSAKSKRLWCIFSR